MSVLFDVDTTLSPADQDGDVYTVPFEPYRDTVSFTGTAQFEGSGPFRATIEHSLHNDLSWTLVNQSNTGDGGVIEEFEFNTPRTRHVRLKLQNFRDESVDARAVVVV